MRILGALCTLALFLFLIAPAPGYAQDREDNKQNQPQDDNKAKDNNNDKAKENNRAPENDKARQQDDRNARPNEARPQDDRNAGRQQDRQNRPEANRPEQQQQRDEHQGQEQRPMDNNRRVDQGMGRDQNQHQAGDRGRRIPDDQFRSHFGREHRFHVQRAQIVNVSQPVVVYGGYSFQLVDPWPAEWSYDDDCYIEDVDGEYFLYDVLHPGMRIAVFVVG
jgi:hypothetical protein